MLHGSAGNIQLEDNSDTLPENTHLEENSETLPDQQNENLDVDGKDTDVALRDLAQFSLAGVSIPTVGRKRGRPKGSTKTAIGLPKGKRLRLAKNVPFQQKDMPARQRQILSWFVNEEDVGKPISGNKLDEDSVESIPENIPSASLDEERADINIILRFFLPQMVGQPSSM